MLFSLSCVFVNLSLLLKLINIRLIQWEAFGPIPRNWFGQSRVGYRCISISPGQTLLRFKATYLNASRPFSPSLPQTPTYIQDISNSYFPPSWSLLYIPNSQPPSSPSRKHPWFLGDIPDFSLFSPNPDRSSLSSTGLLENLWRKCFRKFQLEYVTYFWRLSLTALCLKN